MPDTTFLWTPISFAGIVLAGEEISWGQRLLGISTPEHIARHNTQYELNIHNNTVVFQYVYQGYALIATGFLIAPFVRMLLLHIFIKNNYKQLTRLIPDWYLILYFVPTAIYTYVRLFYDNNSNTFDRWEEISEVFFAFAILFFVVQLFMVIKESVKMNKSV